MWAFTAYAWAMTTVCAAWFARRFGSDRGHDVSAIDSLVWQGGIYAAWLPAAGIVWLLMRRYGVGAISLLVLYQAGVLIVPLEALVSSLIDGAFSPTENLPARVLGRMPICLLLYTAIIAIGLAAANHQRARDERVRARSLEIALSEAREALAKAAPGAPERPGRRLMVMAGSRRVPVALDEIEWFGAADNYVVVHWAGREGLLRATLQSLEGWLDPRVFARCHRSTLVNLARVRETQPLSDGSWRLTLDSGAEVVTSRTYRDDLLARLGR
jgi:DNA-binding LytR/AlgR family response regulator